MRRQLQTALKWWTLAFVAGALALQLYWPAWNGQHFFGNLPAALGLAAFFSVITVALDEDEEAGLVILAGAKLLGLSALVASAWHVFVIEQLFLKQVLFLAGILLLAALWLFARRVWDGAVAWWKYGRQKKRERGA